ncbi:MAG: pyridoxamine 5'-phosphate oxidase family protein [Anaerolineales bacterium]
MERDVLRLLRICQQCSAMTIASVGAEGQPMAASVYFAFTPDLHFYFLSSAHTQHVQNLRRDHRAAVCFSPAGARWQNLRGVQMRGVVTLGQGEEEKRGRSVYLARFPFARALERALEEASLHCFVPDWVRLIDNRLGFGHKEEWSWP